MWKVRAFIVLAVLAGLVWFARRAVDPVHAPKRAALARVAARLWIPLAAGLIVGAGLALTDSSSWSKAAFGVAAIAFGVTLIASSRLFPLLLLWNQQRKVRHLRHWAVMVMLRLEPLRGPGQLRCLACGMRGQGGSAGC